jgi:hypothetical protein
MYMYMYIYICITGNMHTCICIAIYYVYIYIPTTSVIDSHGIDHRGIPNNMFDHVDRPKHEPTNYVNHTFGI